MIDKNKDERKKSIVLAGQTPTANEVVDRFGSATKEHVVSYVGCDNETGQTLKRGLERISQSKLNHDYQRQNLRQQAGFAAEEKYTARRNAENIVSGSKERYSRTDDLGNVNDPLFDHMRIDENGVEVLGSGEQMKFVGSSPKECLSLLKSKRYDKYIEADAKLTVPSDYYEGIHIQIDEDISRIKGQLDYAEKIGNVELKTIKENEIIKLRKIKDNLRNSGITNKEAMEARLHPLLSVAKDIGSLSHRAGIQQAKTGAAISSAISLIRNVVSLCKEEKTVEEAAKDLSFDVATGSLVGYLTGFWGSALKGIMQNSPNAMTRSLSKANLPTTIVTTSIDLGRSIVGFMRGEISGSKCLTDLGEKGIANLGAALFAGIGQTVIPMPVVGAAIGSMMGYMLGSFVYQELNALYIALNSASISYERRSLVERESREVIRMIECYRQEMNEVLERYFKDLQQTFMLAFSMLDDALLSGDTDCFIRGRIL